jgi:uncharacterized phage-associated protein
MPHFNRINPCDLADYVIAKLPDISSLKLQKLLYYIESWHLAILEESLIDSEFEAWLHGPVIRSVFAKYKSKGYFLYDPIPNNQTVASDIVQKMESNLLPDQIELISDVLSEYGSKSDYHLECLTHSEKPWIEARKGVEPGEASTNKLSTETIKQFYKQRLDS